MHSSASTLPPSDAMNPESSDSDVSVHGDERGASPLAAPAQLSPPPPKHILDSSENVQTRLRELSSVEDHNIRKQEMLHAKRRRKDDKIARKRDMQDRQIKAIMDARARRDSRINTRRAREDAAFRAVDDQLEEEETVGSFSTHLRSANDSSESTPPSQTPQAGSTSRRIAATWSKHIYGFDVSSRPSILHSTAPSQKASIRSSRSSRRGSNSSVGKLSTPATKSSFCSLLLFLPV